MYKLISDWKEGDYREIIQYRYNINWDNVVKYERLNDRVIKRVFELKPNERLTEVLVM